MKIKKCINVILSHLGCRCHTMAIHTYLCLKDWSGREHAISYGPLNPDITIFCIRANTANKGEGLLSFFCNAMRRIEYAHYKGWVPFVDIDGLGGVILAPCSTAISSKGRHFGETRCLRVRM